MSLGGKYVFDTMMCLVLPMCIVISCSFVLCVLMALDMFMFVKVILSLICVTSPPPCLCSLVCAYGGVVGYFWCLVFCVSFVSCIKLFDFISDAIYVDLKYDDVFVLWLIVVCAWLGGDLSVMCCVFCAWCCFYDLCGCVYGVSPVRFVLSLFYLCAIQMNPVCVVTSEICCFFICL